MSRLGARVFAVVGVSLLAVSGPLLFVSCSPNWAPDNQSLVSVSMSGQVFWYDLKAKKQVAICKTAPGTRVTMAPNGKGVVVPLVTTKNKEQTVQIARYDLQGKKLDVSPVYTNKGAADAEAVFGSASIDVTPDGKWAVTFLPSRKYAVVYSFETKTFRTISGVIPIPRVLGEPSVIWDASSITPDGKSFIAVRLAETAGDFDLLLVPFEAGPEVKVEIKEAMESSKELAQDFKVGVCTFPHWEGNALVSRQGSGLFKLVGAKLNYVETSPRSATLLEHAKKHEVLVLAELADKHLLQLKAQKELQIWIPGTGARTIVKLSNKQPYTVTPSLDGRMIALQSPQGQPTGLWVLDLKGEKVVEFSK